MQCTVRAVPDDRRPGRPRFVPHPIGPVPGQLRGICCLECGVPDPHPRRLLVAAVAVLLLGALVAIGVGQSLGLSFPPSGTAPSAAMTVPPAAPVVPAPAIARIAVPPGEQ